MFLPTEGKTLRHLTLCLVSLPSFLVRREMAALNLATQDTHGMGRVGGRGLAGGPQHLKPIRELWNIPWGSSTLATGHCKDPN